jgi:hypothetical protein
MVNTPQNPATATTSPLPDRVLQLTIELLDEERRKKASNKAFSDEIKRLKAEIKDAIEGPNAAREDDEEADAD